MDINQKMRDILRSAKASKRWDGKSLQIGMDVLDASTSFSIAEFVEYGYDAVSAEIAENVSCS